MSIPPGLTSIQLRDIEILVQQQMETLESQGKDDETLKEIQKILYSTEVGHHLYSLFFLFGLSEAHWREQDGFEVPESAPVDEEETF